MLFVYMRTCMQIHTQIPTHSSMYVFVHAVGVRLYACLYVRQHACSYESTHVRSSFVCTHILHVIRHQGMRLHSMNPCTSLHICLYKLDENAVRAYAHTQTNTLNPPPHTRPRTRTHAFVSHKHTHPHFQPVSPAQIHKHAHTQSCYALLLRITFSVYMHMHISCINTCQYAYMHVNSCTNTYTYTHVRVCACSGCTYACMDFSYGCLPHDEKSLIYDIQEMSFFQKLSSTSPIHTQEKDLHVAAKTPGRRVER